MKKVGVPSTKGKRAKRKTVGRAPSNASASPTGPSALFVMRVRGREQPEAKAKVISAATPEQAVALMLTMNVSKLVEPIVIWNGRELMVAIDLDLPQGAVPLTDAEIDGLMPANAPKPLAAWITHGGGLRVIFVAVGMVSAVALAAVWLMFVPRDRFAGWPLELKTDSRHPMGLRDGNPCGPVHTYEPNSAFSFRSGAASASDAAIQPWLTDRGMQLGGRYGGDKCPWSCGPSSGNPPVTVSSHGVRCFKCNKTAGWGQLLGAGGGAEDETHRALRAFVHLPHQQHILLARYPLLTPELIAAAYPFMLRSVHARHLEGPKSEDYEKRIERAAQIGSLDIVRGSTGAWLDARTLRTRRVTGKTLSHLPSCFNPPQVEKAEDAGPLEGFVTIHPIGPTEVLANWATPPPGSVFVRRPRADENAPPPVELSTRPTRTDVEDAWTVLNAALPGVNRGYHVAIVAAMLVAQRGVGTPPLVVATGPTGSAKTAQIHLAAGAIGTRAAGIELGTTEDTNRKIGLAIEDGAGGVFVDEVGRVKELYSKVEPILSANSEICFRAKFANERRVAMRAAVFLLGSTIPRSIVRSPELARRAVAYRLGGANKQWAIIDPHTHQRLDLLHARRDPHVRAALDTITAATCHALHDLGPGDDWRRFIRDEHGALELPMLDLIDGDGTERKKAIRTLYELFRSAPAHQLTTEAGWTGWLPAAPGSAAGEHLAVLVDPDGDAQRFSAEVADVQRENLEPILGFSAPELQLLVNRRGRRMLLKFLPTGMRGQGPKRVELPPLGPEQVDGARKDAVVV